MSDVVSEFYRRFPYPAVDTELSRPLPDQFSLLTLNYLLRRPDDKAIPETARIWVAGCGTRQAAQVALRFPRAKVIGTDVSATSLANSQRVAEAVGVAERVQLEEADLVDAPYEDAFDLVFCTGVLHHLADPAAGAARVRRSLRRHGASVWMVYNEIHRRPFVTFQRCLDALGPHGDLGERLRAARDLLRDILGNEANAPLHTDLEGLDRLARAAPSPDRRQRDPDRVSSDESGRGAPGAVRGGARLRRSPRGRNSQRRPLLAGGEPSKKAWLALPLALSVGIPRTERLSLEEEIRRQRPDWEALYRAYRVEEVPWYLAELDPDLERALERAGIAGGRFLDLGTGSGSQAVALARRGFRVTASDLSPTAIRVARSRADPGLGIDFRVDDVLATKLAGPFDFIFDRGCLHSLPRTAAESYVAAVADLLDGGGLLFLKCLSQRERVVEGPARYEPRDIRKLFAGRFETPRIRRTVYQGAGLVQPRALFCVLARRD